MRRESTAASNGKFGWPRVNPLSGAALIVLGSADDVGEFEVGLCSRGHCWWDGNRCLASGRDCVRLAMNFPVCTCDAWRKTLNKWSSRCLNIWLQSAGVVVARIEKATARTMGILVPSNIIAS